jgi:eukaryotic-like serine/threonine-protein kinase
VLRKAVSPSAPDPVPRTPTELNAMAYRPEGFGSAVVQTPPPSLPTPVIPAPAPASPGGSAPESLAGAGGRGRAGVLVVSAVVTVLLAGGSVTYALVGHGGSDSGDIAKSPADVPAVSSSTPLEGKAVPSPSGDKASPSAKPTEKGDKTSPTPSIKPPAAGGDSSGGSGGSASDGSEGTTGDGSTGGSTISGGRDGTTGEDSATGGGGADPELACYSIGGGKYNCVVWKRTKSYTASGEEKGVLKAGTSYFYCQQNLGRRVTHGRWTNVWWAKTDDDRGNSNVFISDVFVEGGENDQPVPGLPVC